jgi:predicted membrane protein
MTPSGTTPNDPQENRSALNASIGAIILIAIGAILFIDNLGIFPFIRLRDYWPLAISAWGIAMLSRPGRNCGMVWGCTMVVIGALLTLGNLHILRVNAGSIWPIFLIAAGVSMLFKRTGWGWCERPRARLFSHGERFGRKPCRNLDANAVFGSLNRRIDSVNFERADLNVVFGELKVDLRGATITNPSRQATVETNAAFGAIKLRIPETWKVVVHGNAVFGAFEDKTVPPRPAPGVDPPVLIIEGNAAFGAVEIEN